MRIFTVAPWLLALTLTGCAATLNPAPGADEVAGRGEGAVTAAEGVRLTARAGAWQGTPRNLQQQLTPVLVTIANEGDAPLRIRYDRFRLVSDAGRRYSALPPFRTDGQAVAVAGMAHYPPAGFAYAPYLSPHFAGAPIYDGPFAVNQRYWQRFGPVMRTVKLPTVDMLRKALPEGVLQPGGRVTGFLYFEGVGPEVQRVRLLADFPHAQTGKRITRLGIPFLVG
jgi:hypothetical protein